MAGAGLRTSIQASSSPIKCFLQRRFASTTCEVAIVGGGPTGLTLCSLLSQMNVKATVIERSQKLTDHPQAHFINHRSMEVFRSMQGLASLIAGSTPPLAHWRKFVYCESLTGRVFGEVDHFPGQECALNPDISPEPVVHFSQNKLLPLLLDRCVDQNVVFGCEAKNIVQSRDHVQVDVALPGDNQASDFSLECKYAVLADGANSSLREKLGMEMDAYEPLQHLVNVHFVSRSLTSILLHNPAMLYFVLNPKAIFALVAHDLQQGVFVAQIPYYPPLQDPKIFDAGRCAEIIKLGMGQIGKDCDLDIRSIRPWMMRAQVAQRFSLGRSVFLIGDAAHVFPPAGGFGMNTGIQDAHNLAWKLAAVIKNCADSSLLESYTLERRPVAIQNAELSVRNWRDAAQVPASLGLDPRHANLLSRISSDVVGVFLPNIVARKVLELGLEVGAAASGLKWPLKSLRERELSRLFGSGNTLRLQYPRDDLGFCYAFGPDLPFQEHPKDCSRNIGFKPCWAPGFRMPHFNLKLRSSGKVISSLDLVRNGGVWPLLITPASSDWEHAAIELIVNGFRMDAAIIKGIDPTEQDYSLPTSLRDQQESAKEGIVLEVIDCEHAWSRLALGHSALVRPDGHIYWVSSGKNANCVQCLKDQVNSMLSGKSNPIP